MRFRDGRQAKLRDYMVKWWRLLRLVPPLVGILLIYAAFVKAVDVTDLNKVLLFDHVPVAVISQLALILIQLELILGAALVFGVAKRQVLIMVIGLFLLYTAQLVYLLFFDSPPKCACLGALQAFQSAHAEAQFGVFRNALILAALVLYGWKAELMGIIVPKPKAASVSW